MDHITTTLNRNFSRLWPTVGQPQNLNRQMTATSNHRAFLQQTKSTRKQAKGCSNQPS